MSEELISRQRTGLSEDDMPSSFVSLSTIFPYKCYFFPFIDAVLVEIAKVDDCKEKNPHGTHLRDIYELRDSDSVQFYAIDSSECLMGDTSRRDSMETNCRKTVNENEMGKCTRLPLLLPRLAR